MIENCSSISKGANVCLFFRSLDSRSTVYLFMYIAPGRTHASA